MSAAGLDRIAAGPCRQHRGLDQRACRMAAPRHGRVLTDADSEDDQAPLPPAYTKPSVSEFVPRRRSQSFSACEREALRCCAARRCGENRGACSIAPDRQGRGQRAATAAARPQILRRPLQDRRFGMVLPLPHSPAAEAARAGCNLVSEVWQVDAPALGARN